METWRRWEEAYLEELMAAGRTGSTVRNASLWNDTFMAFCRTRCGLEDVHQVAAEHVTRFALQLEGEPSRHGRLYTARTREGVLAAVRQFFRWAVERGHLAVDPFAAIVVHHVPVPAPTLTRAQVEALLEAPEATTALGLRDRALLATLYRGALRLGECQGLDLDDVDLEQRLLGLRHGCRIRYHPLDGETAQALRHYLERGRPGLHRTATERALFLGEWGRRLHPRAITRIVREHGQGLGLSVNPRVLRKARARHLQESGATQDEIGRVLDHQSPASARPYYRRGRREDT